jgi:ABC-2 type transport system permease protein
VTPPSRPSTAKAYAAIAYFAFKSRLSSPSDLFGRAMLFVIILGVWSRVWRMTAFNGFSGFTPADAVWYLIATEWVALSIPYVYLEIEAEVLNGEFAYNLQRPVSYLLTQAAQAFGLSIANWAAMGAVGILAARLAAGVWPHVSGAAFALIGILDLAAILASSLIMIALGLLAVWTHDASPCAWVWQKLQFVLGGLMLPLSIYPEGLREAAQWTPFPVLMGNLAMPLATQRGAVTLLPQVFGLVVWIAVFSLILAGVFRRAVRKVEEDGL